MTHITHKFYIPTITVTLGRTTKGCYVCTYYNQGIYYNVNTSSESTQYMAIIIPHQRRQTRRTVKIHPWEYTVYRVMSDEYDFLIIKCLVLPLYTRTGKRFADGHY